MKYYLANLGVHIAVNLILTLIVIVSSDRNKRGQTKHALTYFLPFVVSIVTVLYMINFTAPRLLDLTDVTGQNYYSYTGTLEEISSMNNYFIIDGEKYYINPLRDIPEVGSLVKIRYTRYGKYVIEVTQSEEVNVSDSVNEEIQTAVSPDNG
ncbi:MAG: hypothetical protein IKT14_00545 [Clostridiales bacterium]|nr:hypothetical protein [Clostridiales bacterium]MBR6483480.1 hypothetical protein [Clostridiales bacterium]